MTAQDPPTDVYDLTGALPHEKDVYAEPGSSILITGPAHTGKHNLALRVLAAGHTEGAGILFITTGEGASKLAEQFRALLPDLDEMPVGIIDCSTREQQQAIKSVAAVERVGSPGDLTGISVETAKLMRYFEEEGTTDVRHGLVSITTMLQYLDVSTVFRFLHVYTRRIADTRGLGIFTLDGPAHDTQTVNTISGEFDGVIEVREAESGEREVRVKGLPGGSRKWVEI